MQSRAGQLPLDQEIDAYLNAHYRTGRFMGSVLVARGDEVLFKQVYGWADLEHTSVVPMVQAGRRE